MLRHLFFLKIILFFTACESARPPARILIFSKTSPHGYRHESIEAGKKALLEICRVEGIMADTTEDAAFFTEKNLKKYAAVVFLNTNGEVFGPDEEADFERFIQAGGGFVGIHSASGTEYAWRWFGGLVGAYFKDHPPVQQTPLQVARCDDPATAHLSCGDWIWKDEWYNFRNYEPDLDVLLTINENNYSGGQLPENQHVETQNSKPENPKSKIQNPKSSAHPLAWKHEYDGGRAFYTALGHLPEAYTDHNFQQHLLGGIRYAIGENRPKNYARCRTQRRPLANRFVKTVVHDHLDEPMELDQLPDGKIIVIERHGYVNLFDPATGLLSQVCKLPVYSEMGDGLLGVAVDPAWQRNRRILLYYSSLADSMNVLSQFIFTADTLDRRSEKVILTVPTDHFNCFHAAGSLAFGPDGLLYLATGDNTSPFASEGFAPTDSRPDRKAFDARRSSGNTNDLRGKILRIKVADNGSYTCPEGNLFFKKTENETPEPPNLQTSKPEIYIMGCRNPFRISVDQRRNWLYWGDIGPDAGKSDSLRGPMGFDEINQARRAGNFGWPLFVGDNQAYREFDFFSKKTGAWHDPRRPVNRSSLNTGDSLLPPVEMPFIWYPYSRNREFAMLGEGGRNAMAGPTYYCSDFDVNTRFPDYYDGKTIVYDWMRNWLMAATVDSNGNFFHLEPLADSVRLSRPMDMIVDRKTGSIWLLEYGRQWYSGNPEACLSRIDFVRGNRPPVPLLRADSTAGGLGLRVRFSFKNSYDPDGDRLKFEIFCGSENWLSASYPDFAKSGHSTAYPDFAKSGHRTLEHVFQKAGTFDVVLRATDPTGASASDTVRIFVGNTAPSLHFVTPHNRSFYQPGEVLNFKIEIRDAEDCPRAEGIFCRPEAVQTAVEFFEKEVSPVRLLDSQVSENQQFAHGKALVAASDCSGCHAEDRRINGPSFQEVAARYRRDREFSVKDVSRKIIYGGAGKWGQTPMSAHPQIREEEAIQMARWILSLGDPPKVVQGLPLEGAYRLDRAGGTYVLQAAYRDAGARGQPSLAAETALRLRPNLLEAERCEARSKGVENFKSAENEAVALSNLKNDSWFCFKKTDLAGVRSLTLRLGSGNAKRLLVGGKLEVRRGKKDGLVLASLELPASNFERTVFFEKTLTLPDGAVSELDDLFFIFKNASNPAGEIAFVDWVRFDF